METKKSQNNNNMMEFGMRIARRSIIEEINNGCNKNLILSPLSIHIALNMLASGSIGRTLEQLLGFLGSDSITDLNAQSSLLMELATGNICSNLFSQNSSSSGLNPLNQNQFPQNPSGFIPMLYNSTSSTTNQESDFMEIDDLPPSPDNSIHYFTNHPNQFYQNSSSGGPFSFNPYQFSTNRVTNEPSNWFSQKPTNSIFGDYLPNNPNQLYQNSSRGGPSLFRFPTPRSSVPQPDNSHNDVPEPDDIPKICLINGIWVDKRFPLKHSFKQLAEDVYKANALSVDFQNSGGNVTDEINSWAREASKGNINPLFANTISKDASLVLANALYFKGRWVDTFSASKTKDEDFHLLNRKMVRVPFMKKSDTYELYGSFDGFKILKMKYEYDYIYRRSYAMYIFLPDKNDGLQGLVEKFNSDPSFLSENRDKLEEVKLNELWLPKLKYEYELDAIKNMKELGLDLPFDKEKAEFKEMVETSSEVVYVSETIQKSYIEVNEKGTFATAVTAGIYPTCCAPDFTKPPPIDFVADHPFLFMIKEEKSGVVLFVGAALNPLA